MVDLKTNSPVLSLPIGGTSSDEIDVLAALLREKSNLASTAPTCFPNIQKLVDLGMFLQYFVIILILLSRNLAYSPKFVPK